MAKKSMKEAASAGFSVIDAIATGNTANTQDTQYTEDTPKKKGNHSKYEGIPCSRINLKIPTELKEWVQEAAYEASNAKHTVSITEYICNLIKADKEQHKK